MNKQLSLFAEEILLQNLIDFVHEQGSWQSEDCYKTKVYKKKDFVLIYNQYTYGTKDEKEACHDEIVLEEKNGYLKIEEIVIHRLTLDVLKKYPFVSDKEYYEEYLIKYE